MRQEKDKTENETKRREYFRMVFDISHGFRVNNVKTNLGMISVFGTAEISVVPFLLGAIGMFCVCNILRDNVFKSFFSVTIFLCIFAI